MLPEETQVEDSIISVLLLMLQLCQNFFLALGALFFGLSTCPPKCLCTCLVPRTSTVFGERASKAFCTIVLVWATERILNSIISKHLWPTRHIVNLSTIIFGTNYCAWGARHIYIRLICTKTSMTCYYMSLNGLSTLMPLHTHPVCCFRCSGALYLHNCSLKRCCWADCMWLLVGNCCCEVNYIFH